MIGKLLISAVAFYVTAYLLPGVVISGWSSLLVVSVVWGILAMLVRPLLILLTLPVNIMTLGLFTLVINGVLVLMTAKLVDGFSVDGFGTAVLAAILLSIINMILGR
ncbi:phage holin family protein [Patescibacteria group bacterium]|nr:phage holin family protein [Patescibacteria group bacterium]MBU1200346.1 phage holin family protein [Patescibacteria group bacterium]